jgi:alkylhydroperoxidase/carboxymuconolactone decarboxylase family protein YurZ
VQADAHEAALNQVLVAMRGQVEALGATHEEMAEARVQLAAVEAMAGRCRLTR